MILDELCESAVFIPQKGSDPLIVNSWVKIFLKSCEDNVTSRTICYAKTRGSLGLFSINSHVLAEFFRIFPLTVMNEW